MNYDALLLVSFGGPERREDVIPFLENVLRGRNVPRERMLAVAEHYYHFGGRTPINDQNRSLIAALKDEFAASNLRLPVYWGNRNWHPLLPDTFARMAADGVRNALAFVTSAFSSYSGCRQYRENIDAARGNIHVDKLRVFYNHPGFIEAMAARCREALEKLPGAHLIFTAHSVPLSMAANSKYVDQLQEASRLVAGQLGYSDWKLVYQSRSGSPSQPWLEPDIGDYLRQIRRDSVIAPIGFLSDHMEVIWDLDTEARQIADGLGIRMERAATVGTHPRFVAMIRDLVLERTEGAPRLALGGHGPSHDECPPDCCPAR
jgi:ferrochelatase